MKNNKSKELMQKFSIFFVLLVLIIVSSVMNPNFLSHTPYLLAIIYRTSVLIILYSYL